MARRRGAGRLVVPGAEPGLDRLKLEVAQELGLVPAGAISPRAYDEALDRQKWEVAEELGLADRIRRVGWGEMTTRDCGAIGGRLGGRLGGQMVRRMIALAEQQLAGDLPTAGPRW
ncbi:MULTISPECIES: alpha/beta-type small acid-soluble spore protein [Thermaerobacter]|uniref:Alpha/beta-type small acid-soluble spore protein n=1 Tax=Thermaerobacter composti TaxID=554949 RepID=A0ABZ0QKN6_9FIRM|nr:MULTISPECIES: alpha/beta-type small acid-soluble spore protein [Thermaerobacter]PZN06817.1 MAG: acid-soluble spore protein [Bacillota bacterium]QBS38044.1 alpha/beta-type small acid-soluble spore protein [Thermaerobacter sp. FW80]WPD18056.1 alpha/beta-type small acid-soluble spore protein [Thermaerobacter composti]